MVTLPHATFFWKVGHGLSGSKRTWKDSTSSLASRICKACMAVKLFTKTQLESARIGISLMQGWGMVAGARKVYMATSHIGCAMWTLNLSWMFEGS